MNRGCPGRELEPTVNNWGGTQSRMLMGPALLLLEVEMTVETLAPLGGVQKNSGSHQTIMPNSTTGTFQADDTDNHDFKVDARGKGRMTVFVENPSDKTVTITVYGMHSQSADVGDAGVRELGQDSGDSQFTVTTATNNYECYNDPFPFFLIRVVVASGGDGSTVTVYIDLQQQ